MDRFDRHWCYFYTGERRRQSTEQQPFSLVPRAFSVQSRSGYHHFLVTVSCFYLPTFLWTFCLLSWCLGSIGLQGTETSRSSCSELTQWSGTRSSDFWVHLTNPLYFSFSFYTDYRLLLVCYMKIHLLFFPSNSDKLFFFLSCRLKSLEPEFLVSTPERLLEIVALKGVDISGVSLLVCSCFLFSYVLLQFLVMNDDC